MNRKLLIKSLICINLELPHMNNHFRYGQDHLTVQKVLDLCKGTLKGQLDNETVSKIKASRDIVDRIVKQEEPVYGINTGFGPLCTTSISPKDTSTLQYNILKSHSVGVGPLCPKQISKIMLILKAQALSKGFSGVAISTVERIIWHIDNDVIPAIPSQGSVGASGDLAPLAHLFLPLIGHGEIWSDEGTVISTQEMYKQKGIKSIPLGAKEGLALINGTQFIAAYAVKVVENLQSCLSQADLIGAMMIEGLLGSTTPFIDSLHQLRPYKGTIHVANRMRALLQGSKIVESHKDCDRVQDPYSLRCMPQVHGSSRNAWLHLRELLEIELNAVTDNPVIISDELTISGGNFHGQPLAMALDYACLASAELGNISDRRIYLSTTGIAKNVPKLLMKETGINSAFMMPQYTSAALASENKVLCHPASADSIPTSLGQEDHVSMGSISGRKALQVLDNVEQILAIELMYAAQAFDFHKPLRSTAIIHKVHDHVRAQIDFAEEDRVFGDDMKVALKIIKNKELLVLTRNDEQLKTSTYNNLFENL